MSGVKLSHFNFPFPGIMLNSMTRDKNYRQVCKTEHFREVRAGQLLLRLFRVDYIECEIISKERHLTYKAQLSCTPGKRKG
ncbi:hypothetical protein OIU77_028206 [Salix suchowensis]|uniref:Uncharacterized protein n=1 Tax=Salix suchowensis TaxID=1278906 RepID=A0ABQ9BJ39_9ROSI|nr:hypothetical protein OIU77_028206 [Salix suchowensis]